MKTLADKLADAKSEYDRFLRWKGPNSIVTERARLVMMGFRHRLLRRELPAIKREKRKAI